MADRKITDMSALAAGSQATDDVIAVVDVSEATAANKNKKMTMEALFQGIPGNVGIGTSSPSNLLHISGSSAAQWIQFDGSESNLLIGQNTGTSHFGQTDATKLMANNASNPFVIGNNQAQPLILGTSSTERLRINSSGNVGIGTTVPTSLLHLAANAPYLTFEDKDNNQDWQLQATAWFAIRDQTAGEERLRIDSSGRVGIGVTTMAGGGSDVTIIRNSALRWADDDGTQRADIYGDSSSNIVFRNGTGSTERMRIDSSGRLGLGTSSPSTNLHIRQDQAAFTGIYLENRSASTDSYSGISFGTNTSGTNQWFITRENQTTANLDFALTLGSPTLSLTPTGKVGIGTTSPSYLLHIDAGSTTGNVRIEGELSGSSRTVTLGHNASGQAELLAGSAGGADNTLNIFGRPTVFGLNAANEYARIDSSGRLLVGTSTALIVPDSEGTNRSPGLQRAGTTFADTAISCAFFNTSSDAGVLSFTRSNTTTIGGHVIANAGNSMGTISFAASDGSAYIPGATIKAQIDGTPGANDMPGRLVFSTTADGASSPTERMRISANGRVSIGRGTTNLASFTTGAYLKLSTGADTTTGDFSCESYAGNTGTRYHFGFSNPNGLVGSITTNSSATAYNTSSDYRLKENVVPLTGAADRVNQLQVRRFNFIADPDTTVDGFIAHEAQAVVPEAVTGTHDEVDADGNPVYQGIDQSKLVPLLTAALQEAMARIEQLESKVAALESA